MTEKAESIHTGFIGGETDLDLLFFSERRVTRHRSCHGCLFSFIGERAERSSHYLAEGVYGCGHLRRISDYNAAAGMALCPYSRDLVYKDSDIDSVDCTDRAYNHRDKDDR